MGSVCSFPETVSLLLSVSEGKLNPFPSQRLPLLPKTQNFKRKTSTQRPFSSLTTSPHDRDEAQAPSVHKLAERPWPQPFVQDLHNQDHQLKQSLLTLYISCAIINKTNSS